MTPIPPDALRPLVEVRGLFVSYEESPALVDATLAVEPGRIVAIVGPNGAGKTTLLRSLFGDVPRVGGEVRVGGLDPYDARERRSLWKLARWVGDTPQLFEELTVREFLLFSARAYGVPDDAVDPILRSLLIDFELDPLGDKRIKSLSFGNKRKVHVASGFLSGRSGPRLLVLDEPSVGLDPPSRLMLGRVLAEYAKPSQVASERSVLISSHNLSELSAIADSVVMLQNGRIVLATTIAEASAARTDFLAYDLVLFDPRAADLARELDRELGLYCQLRDPHSLAFTCDGPETVGKLLRHLARTDCRLRELRESLSTLERVFVQNMPTE